MRRKRKRARLRPLPVIAAAAALAAALFAAVSMAVRRPILEAARDGVADEISRAFVTASYEVLTELEEPELLHVAETGGSGCIITADPVMLNAVTASITARAQELISGMGRKGASVELGSASGVALLSGKGPEVTVSYRTMGAVTGDVRASLKSSGINQSLFTVELTLTARLRIFIAGASQTVEIKNTVPICETVVIGEVPQVYTNVANEDDMLNLIPTDVP